MKKLLLVIIFFLDLGVNAQIHYDQKGNYSGPEFNSIYVDFTKAQLDVMPESILNRIGAHPRLFFNTETFIEIKQRALNEENQLFLDFRKRIDDLMVSGIEFENKYVKDGTGNKNHTYGFRAAESAFLYSITKEDKYLQFTKTLLKEITDYYHFRNNENLNIHWYVYSRISALCAYDWIHPFLSNQERTELGTSLFHALNNMLPENVQTVPARANPSGYTSGFYGVLNLRWYLGLVFYKAGIEDSKAAALLNNGYTDHVKLLKHRANLADDDGGAASATLGYAMADYPWAEFNFFHTFQSATGIDMAKEWNYIPLALNYYYWNWWPGDRHAGYGDADHFTNKLDLRQMHIYLSQILHFYGDDNPEFAGFVKWMRNKTPRQQVDAYPFTRFLLRDKPNIPVREPDNTRLPSGRFFPKMGQVFMNSGVGMNDTYAMFSAGGAINTHRHYDNNHFVIYKKGFRALDTGTRPQPGLHLSHYYSRTVAHNSVLIYMPGEIMPKYWGDKAPSEEDLPVPNDGGQSNLLGAEVIAFDENKDYVYIASDATKAYHKDKSELVLRQFLFIAPDIFVVFDKITSKRPEYKKTWLLHTASEPQILNSKEFTEMYDEGKLFCRTLFPENINIEKIGGEGKQFWSGGRNWPIPKANQNTMPLLGQWRVEISAQQETVNVGFLHLMQVGDLSLTKMVDTNPVQSQGVKGLRFSYNSKQYEVLFFDGQQHGGSITIWANGKVIRQENFSQKVKLQSGLYGE